MADMDTDPLQLEFGGNPDALAAVLRAHEPWLKRVLRNRLQGDLELVDEAFQEIGLALTKSQFRPREESRLAAWLYRVAIRQALLLRRKLGRIRKRIQTFERTGGNAVEETDPLQWLLNVEREQSVRAAFGRLSDLDREVLMLKYGERWTYGQLAERLGVTVDTIEYRLLRAKKRLRQALREEDVEVER